MVRNADTLRVSQPSVSEGVCCGRKMFARSGLRPLGVSQVEVACQEEHVAYVSDAAEVADKVGSLAGASLKKSK